MKTRSNRALKNTVYRRSPVPTGPTARFQVGFMLYSHDLINMSALFS